MVKSASSDRLSDIASYYTATLALHGAPAKRVDWNSQTSQLLRFDQLTKIIAVPAGFSLNDFGCGYGALFDYLRTGYRDFLYTGFDISAAMVATARRRNRAANARYVLASEPPKVADFGVASGIFHVRLTRSDSEWRNYFEATLDIMNRTSRRGFSFNCLTIYSDSDKMRRDLYYADPCNVFDHCSGFIHAISPCCTITAFMNLRSW